MSINKKLRRDEKHWRLPTVSELLKLMEQRLDVFPVEDLNIEYSCNEYWAEGEKTVGRNSAVHPPSYFGYDVPTAYHKAVLIQD
jgi:hypothetical protein